ncbi:hypothetical protein AB0G64_36580, partial [Streptomyces longwoodensis]|uniref:hypothetical protein n=1 Tax=Streptomyces longwoodensis TaxID=68231 RepID=UPI0034092AAD
RTLSKSYRCRSRALSVFLINSWTAHLMKARGSRLAGVLSVPVLFASGNRRTTPAARDVLDSNLRFRLVTHSRE